LHLPAQDIFSSINGNGYSVCQVYDMAAKRYLDTINSFAFPIIPWQVVKTNHVCRFF